MQGSGSEGCSGQEGRTWKGQGPKGWPRQGAAQPMEPLMLIPMATQRGAAVKWKHLAVKQKTEMQVAALADP